MRSGRAFPARSKVCSPHNLPLRRDHIMCHIMFEGALHQWRDACFERLICHHPTRIQNCNTCSSHFTAAARYGVIMEGVANARMRLCCSTQLPSRSPSIVRLRLLQRTSALTLFLQNRFLGHSAYVVWHWDYKLACRAHLLAFVVRRDTPRVCNWYLYLPYAQGVTRQSLLPGGVAWHSTYSRHSKCSTNTNPNLVTRNTTCGGNTFALSPLHTSWARHAWAKLPFCTIYVSPVPWGGVLGYCAPTPIAHSPH